MADKIKQLIKDRPEEVEEILNDYSRWLEKHGYMDSDWWCEEPAAVLEYLTLKQK